MHRIRALAATLASAVALVFANGSQAQYSHELGRLAPEAVKPAAQLK